MSFVHLHLHTQYSLLEGAIQIPDLMAKATEFKMPAVSITDNGNMFGAIEFYLAAKENGLNPILGCDFYVTSQGRLKKEITRDAPPLFRHVLLATSLEGYHTLCHLVSRGYTEGFYYKPRIDFELLKQYNKDIIALTGGLNGEIPWTFLNQGPEKALERLQFYQEIYGENLYLEIQRTGYKEWSRVVPFMQQASQKLGIPLVATNDVHYLIREHAFAQDVLQAIGSSKTLQEDRKGKLPGDDFHFKSPEEMRKLFKDIPDACENTLRIAEKCKLQFKFKDEKGNPVYHLPTFPVPIGKTITDEIREQAFLGLQKRMVEALGRGETFKEENGEVFNLETVPAMHVPDLLKNNDTLVSTGLAPKHYIERLEYELSIIRRMGFEGYFLIVSDFIKFAKNNEIPVGPGRGSGAGSLVAYCLFITDLDPLPYNLLFERFLNPERISMPDFDVDFCQDRRGEVIDYVTKKYGHECVAQIITFGKLQAKAAIRDVGRAMGMSYGEVDAIAKLVPEKLGISLGEAIEMEPRFKEWSDNDPRVANLLKTAQDLEGTTRHASIHAAGVIIASRPLVEYCPLYKGAEGETVIQYDMIHAEKIGLVKFDFLGLKTLTMIRNAVLNVRANRGVQLETSQIRLDDRKIYELLSKGDTAGVFQFEGEGITEFIAKFKPGSFEDITAINALYRPGPMDMLDEYIARKQGKIKISYVFPELEEILKETYGIIVYQEQVQMIAARIANYSLGEADMLRRAMGKKKPEEMAKQKARFLKGAEENKHNLKKAGELFDLMEKFAGYGFNKSHAAAYCVVAAQTAYLKVYYPVEFFASLITTEMSDTDKLVWYIKDAQEHGIEVMGPDINQSRYKFVAVGDKIVFGLGGIKGVGESAVDAIIEARDEILRSQGFDPSVSNPDARPFESAQEFFESVDLRRVNKKVIECLVKAGAFDQLEPSRARLMANYERILDAAETAQKDKETGQVSLFEMAQDSDTQAIKMTEVPEWSRSQKLAFEKEALGFYLTDHPLAGLESVLSGYVTGRISELKNLPPKRKVTLGGVIGSFKEFITKKGARMAFASLEDQTGSVELIIFSDAYAKFELLLKTDKPLIINGVLESEENSQKIFVDGVATLDEIASRSNQLLVRLDSNWKAEDLGRLKEVLLRHKGEVPGVIEFYLPELGKKVTMELGPEFKIAPNERLFEDLERQFGSKNMAVLQ